MNLDPVKLLREFTVDQLPVRVFADRTACGGAAARHVGARLRERLESAAEASICFGAAPSQNEFFAALAEEPGIDWVRVVAFEMDEYLGVGPEDPRLLRRYFARHLYHRIRPGQTPFLQPDAPDPLAECRRYAALLLNHPLDIACVGIGESGHLAYNDPHVARFDDPELVKVVTIDETSRRQQVHDGTVRRVEDAIGRAYTLTLPALMGARHVSCVAPGRVKAAAVARALSEPIGERCPATILRRHPRAVLFLDRDSAGGSSGTAG